ncbi:hypothetical protein TNCV_258691 [Trichonephila clavipes]|uniref:Uncharacterized protein n=1 Tax=Trichonephila clavipes TaxID=2585209 RepID=A0A8X6RSN0_TRICX|nr:hypothetical protein TNCV_258691 [Trichonephila clavipes]
MSELDFILASFHSPQSPKKEAVCRSSGKKQARRLPGVHPEYSAKAPGRGSLQLCLGRNLSAADSQEQAHSCHPSTVKRGPKGTQRDSERLRGKIERCATLD